MTRQLIWKLSWIVLGAAMLPGCDQISERAGFPDPAKLEAEGKAIGGACRHAGRGLEDCYRLNGKASKPAVYAGWKEMNEYMSKNNMQAVEPTIPNESADSPASDKKKKTDEGDATEADKTKKEDGHASKAEAAKAPEKGH